MKIKNARRILRQIAYGGNAPGRMVNGQAEAARMVLARLDKLETDNARLRRDAAELDSMSVDEIGEMLAGM